MTQTASNYGTVLFELGVKKEIVEKTKEIFSLTEELPKMLQSPIVSKDAKHRLIEDIFPEEIRNFLKVVSDHQEMDLMDDIFVAYKKAYDENHGILCAEMSYVMEPDAKQVEQMKAYLANKYGKAFSPKSTEPFSNALRNIFIYQTPKHLICAFYLRPLLSTQNLHAYKTYLIHYQLDTWQQ